MTIPLNPEDPIIKKWLEDQKRVSATIQQRRAAARERAAIEREERKARAKVRASYGLDRDPIRRAIILGHSRVLEATFSDSQAKSTVAPTARRHAQIPNGSNLAKVMRSLTEMVNMLSELGYIGSAKDAHTIRSSIKQWVLHYLRAHQELQKYRESSRVRGRLYVNRIIEDKHLFNSAAEETSYSCGITSDKVKEVIRTFFGAIPDSQSD